MRMFKFTQDGNMAGNMLEATRAVITFRAKRSCSRMAHQIRPLLFCATPVRSLEISGFARALLSVEPVEHTYAKGRALGSRLTNL